MMANSDGKIWIVPSKFWRATNGLNASEAERLYREVETAIQHNDVSALRKFEFVSFTDPAQEWRIARRKTA